MNKQDIQRNFSHSYFGYKVADLVRKAVIEAGLNANDYDLAPGYVTPMTAVQIDGRFLCRAVLKLRGNQGYTVHRLNLGKWVDDMDEDEGIFWTGVPRGQMVQVEDTCVYLRRSPYRDTPRGYCPKFTHITVCSGDMTDSVYTSEAYSVVWNLYNPVESYYYNALQSLNDGDKLAIKVGTHLAVGLAEKRRHPQLFYRNKGSIGFVDENARPVLFHDKASYPVHEYVHKITGITPLEK
jgi:hypothetical protein